MSAGKPRRLLQPGASQSSPCRPAFINRMQGLTFGLGAATSVADLDCAVTISAKTMQLPNTAISCCGSHFGPAARIQIQLPFDGVPQGRI